VLRKKDVHRHALIAVRGAKAHFFADPVGTLVARFGPDVERSRIVRIEIEEGGEDLIRGRTIDGEITLHRGNGSDGLLQAALDMPAAAEQAGLVEMDMAVDEAWQHQPPAEFDLDRLAGETRRDGGDPPAGHADVDRCRRGPRHGVAEDLIEGGAHAHGDA